MKYQDPKNMEFEDMVDVVNEHLTRRELLEQLAEEAAELAIAAGKVSKCASKLIRAEGLNNNPCRMDDESLKSIMSDALDSVEEERSDVNVVVAALRARNSFGSFFFPTRQQEEKMRRWVREIQEQQVKGEGK
ncbi:hypothetical protein [Acidaminococcus sp.]|uniref:hypothetical protein n=1 Tax=Acidaminococcus sp. TaxID=1872103 RepID=UPI003D7EBE1F